MVADAALTVSLDGTGIGPAAAVAAVPNAATAYAALTEVAHLQPGERVRPKLTARGDPYHDHVVAGIVARLLELPRRAVVLAEDETHLNLLRTCGPAGRCAAGARRSSRRARTAGSPCWGALEVAAGAWVYRLGRCCAADFIALLDRLLAAFPQAPVIAVICDNDSIHHARKVTAYLKENPRLALLYGARYSPHDNPAERTWGALKTTWPTPPSAGPAGSGRSIPSSVTARQIRCWLPPRPGPAPGYLRVTSRTSGMPLFS